MGRGFFLPKFQIFLPFPFPSFMDFALFSPHKFHNFDLFGDPLITLFLPKCWKNFFTATFFSFCSFPPKSQQFALFMLFSPKFQIFCPHAQNLVGFFHAFEVKLSIWEGLCGTR